MRCHRTNMNFYFISASSISSNTHSYYKKSSFQCTKRSLQCFWVEFTFEKNVVWKHKRMQIGSLLTNNIKWLCGYSQWMRGVAKSSPRFVQGGYAAILLPLRMVTRPPFFLLFINKSAHTLTKVKTCFFLPKYSCKKNWKFYKKCFELFINVFKKNVKFKIY